jgi:hypothetical protein
MKKPFLVRVDVRDGEIDYRNHAIYYAESQEDVKTWFEANSKPYFAVAEWSIVTLEGVEEIKESEAKVLRRLGVVYNVEDK